MRRAIFSLICALALVAPARADVRILSSPGGDVVQYLTLFSLLKATGERIVIDGPCLSACTLVLSTFPRQRICVTPRASLGFHAAQLMDADGQTYPASEATRVLAGTYPAPIRTWINRHGGLTSQLIVLRGRELAALFHRCA